MTTYLVRKASDHEAIGIFWASSIQELGYIIDCDCIDPQECEIKVSRCGGIGWFEPTNVKFPIQFDGDDEVDLELESLSFSDALNLTDEKGWRPFGEWSLFGRRS